MLRAQQRVKQHLKNLGYTNIYIVQHTRWSKDIAVDNARFDGIALKPKEKPLFFQVKSNAFPVLKPFKTVAYKYYNIRVALFVWKDHKGLVERYF